MTQNGNSTTTLEDIPSEVTCEATGARPAVDITWYHQTNAGNESRITDISSQINYTNGENSDTFDTLSMLQYASNKDYNGGVISCLTTGQEVAQSRRANATLNVQCKYFSLHVY